MVARAAAAKAAPKAAPARARKAPAAKAVEPEVDLLAGMEDASAPHATDDPLDLLADISEDNGVAWIPSDEDADCPDGIQGRLVYRGSVESDYGNDVPMLEIEQADGEVWSVRAYHTVLRNQIEKADPAVGDTVAIKYFGLKSGKGDDYHNYKVVVRRA